jgi:uncharacterized protein (DUF302 family)
MTVRTSSGLVAIPVAAPVLDVVEQITEWLPSRRARIFAIIDHAAAARDVGLDLQDEVLLVFGNPTVGTTLMQSDPTVGVDLPLRVLVYAAGDHSIVAYREPDHLAQDHDLEDVEETVKLLSAFLHDMMTAVQEIAA